MSLAIGGSSIRLVLVTVGAETFDSSDERLQALDAVDVSWIVAEGDASNICEGVNHLCFPGNGCLNTIDIACGGHVSFVVVL